MTTNQAVLDWLNTEPDWDAPAGRDPMVPVTDGPVSADVTAPSAATLASVTGAERMDMVFDYVRREVARSVGVTPAALDTERTLVSVGVGSMLGLELQYRLRSSLGVAPELTELLMAKDTHALAAMVVALLGAGG
ncbi:acyl carrier protein [Streptomyces sp. G-G2]|uniref:acyl carrier protein n=1 Tax=Streptomyces sp. G-G2 TaxID=3046201 RepID=UPI0024BADD9B|nr:acyl carrier protein [Streptomyces sp. G-G2]MDJ0382892.1 acyl carrier protein [Streptomyces sp. G-G2]